MAKDYKPQPKPKSKLRRRPPIVALTTVVDRLGGARLCYGEPIREAGRTIVPVARVRANGGAGWGSGGGDEGGGGGGGGRIDAVPLGFIEVGPEGSRFQAIDDPEAVTRRLRSATATVVAVATTLVGLRAARGGRRLLGRGGT